MFDFFSSLLNSSPVVQGGLTLMVIGWLGYQARALPDRVLSWVRLWTTRQVEIREHHPHYDAWLALLTEHAVRPGGPRTLEVRRAPGGPRLDAGGPGAASPLAAGLDTFWVRVFGRWCRVHVYREGGAAGGRQDLIARCMISVEVFFGTRAHIERMSLEAARRADAGERVQLVDVHERYGDTSTIVLPKRHGRTLCLPAGFFESVESRLREFGEAREQYETAGIPWRFGVLLAGTPGTGKTSLAHALASHLNLRLVVIPLADMESDRELIGSFRGVTERAIVLIEDVDCAFKQRDADAAAGISFSGLLNCIDGLVAPHNGRILIMTTNHPEKLDPALVRPGRVDLNVSVPALDRQAALDYVDRIFPHVPMRHAIVDEVMATETSTGAPATPAVLINRITREKWRRTAALGMGASQPVRVLRREPVWKDVPRETEPCD